VTGAHSADEIPFRYRVVALIRELRVLRRRAKVLPRFQMRAIDAPRAVMPPRVTGVLEPLPDIETARAAALAVERVLPSAKLRVAFSVWRDELAAQIADAELIVAGFDRLLP